jgi:hypothetical protein
MDVSAQGSGNNAYACARPLETKCFWADRHRLVDDLASFRSCRLQEW